MDKFETIARALDELLSYSDPCTYENFLTEMWESWIIDERNDNAGARERADKLYLYKNLSNLLHNLKN